MDDTERRLRAYTHCRTLLGVNLSEFLNKARLRKIDEQHVIAAAESATTKNTFLVAMKNTGLTLQDIGDVLGLSRERVRQLITNENGYGDVMFEPRAPRRANPEQVAIELYRIAATRPDMYSKRGVFMTQLACDIIAANHPEWSITSIRQIASKVDTDTCTVAMHNLGIPVEERAEWIKKQRRDGRNSKEILAVLNRGLAKPVSETAFSRYRRKLKVRPGYGIPVL